MAPSTAITYPCPFGTAPVDTSLSLGPEPRRSIEARKTNAAYTKHEGCKLGFVIHRSFRAAGGTVKEGPIGHKIAL